ncbi:MAG: sialate O-acetylesterase [Kiritimatiellia bacterium]
MRGFEMQQAVFAFGLASLAFASFAGIEMGAPFTDGAVLQREMRAPVWGKVTDAGAGVSVEVSFAGQVKTAAADAQTGAWRVDLDPLAASRESRTLTVRARRSGATVDEVAVRDVLVGEVWLASGQSNMECPIWGGSPRYRDGKGALMTAMTRLPDVRFVSVASAWSVEPRAQRAEWRKFVSTDLAKGRVISAVAFYYARELHLALGIPVGIVSAAKGGTNIDAWTPRCGYADCDPSIQATAAYPVAKEWDETIKHKLPIDALHQQPTVLFNGMVAAFAPMAARGLIWYQGCHNSGEAHLYCAKMHALYNGWSRAFENPELRLYFVELAPWINSWMGICAAQNQFVAEQKNAAIAVTADIGNFDDIHPNDKETVAQRLVVHALKRDYGFDIAEDCSPVFKSAEFADGKATLHFDHVKDWYVYAPDRSQAAAFELAGADGVWHPARIVNFGQWRDKTGKLLPTDRISGPSIVLASDAVAKPTTVRYLGRARTAGTMYNEASLPLGAFETK